MMGSLTDRPSVFFSKAALLILVIALCVYGQVLNHEFLNIDDNLYVSQNPHIRDGLTLEGIGWAFSAGLFFYSPNVDYWIPITVISRMVDIEIFGFNPAGHHAVNLIIHMVNVLLLLVVLARLGISRHGRWLIAALFALHPVHTEAVAWITARKDLLSSFLMLAGLWFYSGAVKEHSRRLVPVLLLIYLAAFWSKPSALVLPAYMIACDFLLYDAGAPGCREGWGRFLHNKKLVIAVGFLLGLSVLFGGGVRSIAERHEFHAVDFWCAGHAYLGYIGRMVFPFNLGIYGPVPVKPLPGGAALASWIMIGAVTVMVWRGRRGHRMLFAGWWWFLAGLLPVIFMKWPADRFMYLPAIGIYMMFWGIIERVLARLKRGRRRLIACLSLLVIFYACIAHVQTTRWKNDLSLLKHMIHIRPDNYLAHNNLGVLYYDRGNYVLAAESFAQAVKIRKFYENARRNLRQAQIKAEESNVRPLFSDTQPDKI